MSDPAKAESTSIADIQKQKQIQINDFIKAKIEEFTTLNFKDDNLWEAYQDEFSDFSINDFKAASNSILRSLRIFLRSRGVWVKWERNTTLVNSLYNTLKETSPTEWTSEEVNNSNEFFDSVKIFHIAKTQKASLKAISKLPAQQPPSTSNMPSTKNQESESGHRRSHQSYGYGKELSILSKLYENDLKYHGDNDNFDFKLGIFFELCDKAEIPEQVYGKAFSTMLSGAALQHYYTTSSNSLRRDFETLANATRDHFEGPEVKRRRTARWESLTLQTVIDENHGKQKSMDECFVLLLNELRHLQLSLDKEFRTEKVLHTKLINSCRNIPACQLACFKPSNTLTGLISDLQSSISISDENIKDHSSQFFTDRKYHKNFQGVNQNTQKSNHQSRSIKRRCYVCERPNCHSKYHSDSEQDEARKKFKRRFVKRFDNMIPQYLANLEGDIIMEEEENDSELDEKIDALVLDISSDKYNIGEESDNSQSFMTSFGPIEDPKDIVLKLADRSFAHVINKDDKSNTATNTNYDVSYVTWARYNSDQFYGILIDTGASKYSTAGYKQFQAFNKILPSVVDKSKAGAINVQFGIGSSKSIGSTKIHTPIGLIEFHIVQADTPFLLSLSDMDKLQVFYDNIKNKLITPSGQIPVQRRFGHAFLLWGKFLEEFISHSFNLNPCFLTEQELKRIHRRFGHPSAQRLYNILQRSGHEDISKVNIDYLNKFCHHCQINKKAPGRFKFKLQDDSIQFNNSILADIMYINNKPILHVIDEATRFQAARWLNDISSRSTWDAIRSCWIDVYIGPPDHIITDAGSNFTSKEFHENASSMSIKVNIVPVEAHWSIGLVERYHALLRRSYQIISDELKNSNTGRDVLLQMAIKAINDTAGPNGLVPTLLVFGAYPRMSNSDLPSPSIAQRAIAMRKAMDDIRKIHSKSTVNKALNQRNGPNNNDLYNLPLNSEVLVWRESKIGQPGKWDGPFKLISIENETCTINLPSGPTNFRSTSVRPYYTNNNDNDINSNDTNNNSVVKNSNSNDNDNISNDNGILHNGNVENSNDNGNDNTQSDANQENNKLSEPATQINQEIPYRRNQPRNRQLPRRFQNPPDLTYICESTIPEHIQFKESREIEIKGLLEKGVFENVNPNQIPHGTRIFSSRFVDSIKHIGTDKEYKKSRLVVQAYNDKDKETVLTQSPTLQRVSQRIILSIAAILRMNLYLRDITQAYVQSVTKLSRDFYIRAPKEMSPENKILKVVKPLYGVPEAGNHWFFTYHKHHTNNLSLNPSTFDPCLLYINDPDKNEFAVVGMQTDDTLFLANEKFAKKEDHKLKESKLIAKEREILTTTHALKFNGGYIHLEINSQSINLSQEIHCNNLNLVELRPADITSTRSKIQKSLSPRDQYVAQRARGAYIATVCQPESSFDLSSAAQTSNPDKHDIHQLNKRIKWQKENSKRGLRFVQLDKASLQLVVFTDSSFANNKDFSSQIGYVIIIKDKYNKANILHWSSTKSKRVTRSVLAAELYGLVNGFDAAVTIKSTLESILTMKIPLTICTDSKSLYDCLVKLGTTREKRLMIDLMCLRQSYENREITEIRWIKGQNNPADAMTKSKCCNALKNLIDSNKIEIVDNQWVERNSGDFQVSPVSQYGNKSSGEELGY